MWIFGILFFEWFLVNKDNLTFEVLHQRLHSENSDKSTNFQKKLFKYLFLKFFNYTVIRVWYIYVFLGTCTLECSEIFSQVIFKDIINLNKILGLSVHIWWNKFLMQIIVIQNCLTLLYFITFYLLFWEFKHNVVRGILSHQVTSWHENKKTKKKNLFWAIMSL